MRFQLAAARTGLGALVLGALAAAAAVIGVRLGRIDYALAYQVMTAAVVLGLIALAAALAWMRSALKRNDGTAKRTGLVVLVGSALLLYPPLSTIAHRLTAPPLNDVSTDTGNPPAFVALLKMRGPHDNSALFDGNRQIRFQGETQSIAYALHEKYPDVMKPHSGFAVGSKSPADTFYQRDLAAVQSLGWTIVETSEKDGRIEATTSSFWFARPFDIVIRARPAGPGARTDIRVQSRSDALDDGASAGLIKHFLKVMQR